MCKQHTYTKILNGNQIDYFMEVQIWVPLKIEVEKTLQADTTLT